MRVVLGVVFFAHGAQKLLVFGIAGVGANFAHMGFPLPGVAAAVVTLLEFLGGLALIVGLLTRWTAALLAMEMAVAVLKVHLPGGFFLPRGFEFAFTLCCLSLALMLTGPGKASLDRLLFRDQA